MRYIDDQLGLHLPDHVLDRGQPVHVEDGRLIPLAGPVGESEKGRRPGLPSVYGGAAIVDQPLCLFTLLYAPRERHEQILADFVTPIARDLCGAPELHSLFFARFNVPSWQVRFRILGGEDWVEGPVRERVERALAPLVDSGIVEKAELAQYDREVERYGGPYGMALAEELFLHDSLACLDLMEAERRGLLGKSRREISLLLAERLLDLLQLDRAERLAFYEQGYRWTREMGTWDDAALAAIEAKYQALKPGLADLFAGPQAANPALLWGGEEPARIAARWSAATRPLAAAIREGHAAGRIQQDLIYLAWSYAHMQCNRLGIDPTPEAFLRYFMHRLLEDGAGPAAAPPS